MPGTATGRLGRGNPDASSEAIQTRRATHSFCPTLRGVPANPSGEVRTVVLSSRIAVAALVTTRASTPVGTATVVHG